MKKKKPIPASIVTVENVSRHFRIEIGAHHIREWLRQDARFASIPGDAEVFFHVPGGGDWSNEDLSICPAFPVIVKWTDTTKSRVENEAPDDPEEETPDDDFDPYCAHEVDG